MSEIVGTQLELSAADGATIGAYRVQPSTQARAGLVLVQEIFGVNGHIRGVAEGFAREGYDVIVPQFFDRIEREVELGYDEAGVAKGLALVTQLGLDKPLLDITAASQQLVASGKVGIVGYCWGGSMAYLAAARLAGLGAAVGYYGSLIPRFASEPPRVPVLLHFGKRDKGIPLEGVDKLRAERPELDVQLYDAGHGFNCDQRGSYDDASARLALRRTLAFFAQHLVAR
jgi:carboxymethylenebutenolidase